MEARLPQEKLDKCKLILRDFLRRKKVSLREMQSLIGLLNFTCSVVLPGRTFLRRMINVTVGVRRPAHSIRLKREVKADLQMWLQFLDHYNGKSFYLDFIWFSSDLFICTRTRPVHWAIVPFLGISGFTANGLANGNLRTL